MDQTDGPTRAIARRVRQLREERDWTAQQLADAVTAAGVEWNRGQVAKLENGRRENVSVVELLALAWVFDVFPPVLLLPDDGNAEYQITPTVKARAERAYRWMVGAKPVPVDTDENDSPFTWGERIRWYASARPSYMARSIDPDAEREDQQRMAERLAAIEKHLGIPGDGGIGGESED